MKKKDTSKKGSALVKSNENGVKQSYTACIVINVTGRVCC